MYVTSSARPVVSSPGKFRQFLQHHPLICYFALTFGISWLGWLPYILSQSGFGVLPVSLSQFALLPGAFLGPCLSGFLMTAATDGKLGIRRLLRRFILWRVGWQWYLFNIIVVPVSIFLGYLAIPGALAVLHNPFPQLFVVYPLFLILEIFTSGLAEEPGWRGFALPRLQTRYGALLGTVILGVLWGCWHLPLFLTAWGNGGSWLDAVVFVVTTVGNAIMFTWVFNHTRGSLLMMILIHAAIDAYGSAMIDTRLFPLHWTLQYNIPAQLLGFGVIPLVLIIATRGRLGYRQTSSPEAMPVPNESEA